MAWNIANSTSTFTAYEQVNKQMDGRGKRDLSSSFENSATGQYSIVGIKAGNVEGMREAIRTYVKRVEGYLEEALGNANANMDTAFRGNELQTSVKEYLTKVKDYCNNLVSTLLAFSDKLADVSNAWLAATQAMSSNVSESSGSFSAGERYVDNLTANSRTQ